MHSESVMRVNCVAKEHPIPDQAGNGECEFPHRVSCGDSTCIKGFVLTARGFPVRIGGV